MKLKRITTHRFFFLYVLAALGVVLSDPFKRGSLARLDIDSAALVSILLVLFLILGIARAISMRKEAELALLETQRSFREMLSNLRMVSMILDKKGCIVFCNDFLLEVTGRRRQEAMGADWIDLFIPPEIREELRSLFGNMIAGGHCPTCHENEILATDGRRLLISWNNTLLRNAQGEITGTASIGEDISERRRMETILQEGRLQFQKLSQEFQTVLDGIPDSLTLISAERRIVWANCGTINLLGLKENPTDLTCRELQCCHENGCGSCPVDRSFAGGMTESDRLHGPDGRIWGVKTFPLAEADGRVTQVIRWASDITEQIQVQEDAMRSSRLASLGELAAGVAHEINNPNGLILLNSALLQDVLTDAEPLLEEHFREQGNFTLGGLGYERLREELPHILSETLDAAQRIRRIVEDLKNFARQDAVDLFEKVDLNAAVQTAIRLVKPVLAKTCDAFALNLSENLPTVSGNSQRLEQVIVNLLMNACQALPDRSRAITLTTRFEANRGRVVLIVRDEGIGIPPEVLAQITNPFFTTRREVGGTGLGLAVSTRIIREHGGQMRFESRPGAGTTVKMVLAVSKENSPE